MPRSSTRISSIYVALFTLLYFSSLEVASFLVSFSEADLGTFLYLSGDPYVKGEMKSE